MKNVLFSIIILGIACGCVSTEKQNSSVNNNSLRERGQSLIQYIKDGEYAFYLDKRYNPALYRGYMKYASTDNKAVIVVRAINVDSGIEERFFFTAEDDENGYPTVIKDITGRFSSPETRQAIPDFQNFTSIYLRTQNEYEKQSNIDDDWGNFTLVFTFDKSLPFFKFSDVKVKGNDESSYLLLYGGVLDNITLDAFFELDPSVKR